jgi:hypothetical protein
LARHVHVLQPQLPILRSGSGASFCWRRPYVSFLHPVAGSIRRQIVLLDYLVLPPLVGAEEDIIVPLLQRYLNIEDRKAAENLHAVHVPVFRKAPSPLLPGLPQLREYLVQKYPYVMSLREPDMADASLIDDPRKRRLHRPVVRGIVEQ